MKRDADSTTGTRRRSAGADSEVTVPKHTREPADLKTKVANDVSLPPRSHKPLVTQHRSPRSHGAWSRWPAQPAGGHPIRA